MYFYFIFSIRMVARVLVKNYIFLTIKCLALLLYNGTGTIRVVVWGEDLCKKFNELFQVGLSVFFFSFFIFIDTHVCIKRLERLTVLRTFH